MVASLLRLSLRRSARHGVAGNGVCTGSVKVGRPNFSTAAKRQREDETQAALPGNLRIRNILHASSQLFVPGSPVASEHWLTRTETTAARLAETAQHWDAPLRPLRIAIVGEEKAETQGLVDAILDDPMLQYGHEQEEQEILEALSKGRKAMTDSSGSRVSLIRYGEDASFDDRSIALPSKWLGDEGIELLEIVDPPEGSQTASLLYSCDQVIFVLDELTIAALARFGVDLKKSKTVRLLQHLISKPETRVVINQSDGHAIDDVQLEKGLQMAMTERVYEQLMERRVDDERADGSPFIRTSVQLAFRANSALRSALSEAGPTSPPASSWDHFSTLYAASGLSSVKASIVSGASDDRAAGKSLASSLFLLFRALDHASTSLNRDLEHAKHAFHAADALLADVSAEREGVVKATFPPPTADDDRSGIALHKRTGDRSKSAAASDKDAWNVVENTFATRLPWWKILWKVDDVRAEVEAAIARGFAKQLEHRLILQTGRLYSVAERLHRNVRALFTDLEGKNDKRRAGAVEGNESRNPFHSPLLLNELRKYPLEKVEAELKSDVVLQPLKARRDQLIASGGPLDLLCRRAQKNTLTTVGTFGITGFATLTAGMAGSTTFGSAFPTLLHSLSLQPTTAAATFAFTTLASLWLTQSRWTRAKRRFWRDWERVSDGMEADLERNLCETFDRTVAAQNLVAADGLREKASRYVREIEQVQDAISAILTDLRRETDRVSSGARRSLVD